MRYFCLTFIFLIPIEDLFCQKTFLSDPQPYFSAFIVSNIDSSASWYQDILGFELITITENKERGFYQSNLRRGESLIELIQLSGTLSQN